MSSAAPSSSLASLKEALDKASSTPDILLSPTYTNETGCTGSSESRGAASRSLIASVVSRELSYGKPGASIVASSRRSDHPDSLRSDASWTSVSHPSLPLPMPFESDEADESDLSLDVDGLRQEGSFPNAGPQEVDMLRLPVTRSQSELRDWLRTTLSQARGDGTSTVDSEDAVSIVADLTTSAHLGLGPPALGYAFRRLGSVSASTVTSSAAGDFLSSSIASPTYDLDDLLESEALLLSSIEEDTLPAEVEPEIIPAEKSSHGEQQDTASLSPSLVSESGRWKVATIILACALLVSNLQPHYTSLRHRLFQLCQQLVVRSPVPVIVIPIQNVTHIDPPLADLGAPLPPYTLPALAAVSLVVISAYLVATTATSATSHTPRSRRSTSPLLDQDPSSTLDARERIGQGRRLYGLGQLQAALKAFEAASSLNGAHEDKVIATEWLGRTRYRLARVYDSPELMTEAVAAFERAIRLDTTKATTRASLGRALYVLGDFEGAVKALHLALRRAAPPAYAFEYLGKALAALGQWEKAELRLREATSLDEMAYTAHAFLGERLHMQGRTREAKVELEAALKIRCDYPAAHARLAFIAIEQLDRPTAAKHLRLAIKTRETGIVDENLPMALEALQGAEPFFSLYFALGEADRAGRMEVLEEASRLYPHEELLQVLSAGNLRRSKGRDERRRGIEELKRLQENLERRTRRYEDEVDLRGLLVLVLFASGLTKAAEKEYSEFWSVVSENREMRTNARIAAVVMAILELRRK